MNSAEPRRPDPDALLQLLKMEEERQKKGKLKIFFGMCAGVGKTYDMLLAAQEARKKGIDIVVGYVETHGRSETEARLEGLPLIPRKTTEYRGTLLEEMDLDAILARKPALALVDELAHTNAPGSRHTKRYLDVLELLENGIDVYTTLNVQHLESRADTIAQITGAVVRETVPDSIFEQADELAVVDLPPDELLKRLAEGKVYTAEQSARAVENFFRPGNLTALREMAMRITAERLEHQLRDYMRTERIQGPWKTGQRLLIGIGPSPQAVHLIRWARRMAFTMQASWVAVNVETPAFLNDAAKNQLGKNIALARELGAEIVTTADEDIAPALLRTAREQNATQILIGKPGISLPFRKTILERLLAGSGGFDIYIVGSTTPEEARRARRIMPGIHSAPIQYLLAPLIIGIVSLLCYPLHEVVGYQTVSLILLLTVALLPLRFGEGPVLLSAAISALIWDFFFIPPQFTLAISKPHDILMLVAYFVIAAVTGLQTVRIRNRERALRTREQRTTALYHLTEDLSRARTQEEVARSAVGHIKKVFGADTALFLSGPDGDFLGTAHPESLYRPDEKEKSVAAWTHWNEQQAGRFTDTLPFAEATYYPLPGPRYPLGVIGVRHPADRLSIDQQALLATFIRQIAIAVDREFLNELAKRSIAAAESERLYTTLFNSISHEIRTPVTALVSSAETLMNDAVAERTEIRRRLASEIQLAADSLDRIVRNLLAMTRIESGLIQPRKDWCDLRDLLQSAADKVRRELGDRPLTIEADGAMPLVKLDYPLIEQALVNILRNAAMYTPPGSALSLRAGVEGERCRIEIRDAGPGIPSEALPNIFRKFYRAPGSKTGGLGLGLSIASGFVEAHGGSITAANRPEGGAVFTILLPVPEQERSDGEEQHGD